MTRYFLDSFETNNYRGANGYRNVYYNKMHWTRSGLTNFRELCMQSNLEAVSSGFDQVLSGFL